MSDKVKVRIKPLMGIGGVGNAGDEVWMSREDAEMYVREGYVEVVDEEAVSGQQSVLQAGSSTVSTEEDHAIFKPEVKRGRKVARKK